MVISFTSCVSNKDMTYLQGVEQQYAQYRDMTTTYSLKIGADDQLAISITSRDNKLISIFNNQTLIGSGVGSSQASTQNTQAGVSYFTVDKDGYIPDSRYSVRSRRPVIRSMNCRTCWPSVYVRKDTYRMPL